MAKILLADDDSAARDLVRRALEAEGHRVHVTEDGNEARDAFDAAPASFDLLVTDIEMPGSDGVALARHAIGASGSIKVLLMSGFTDALERGRSLAPGRIAVLTKPFTLEQIRARVRAVLS
jgi:DNA-binding response OmpR family regulator